jgi:hypothetical protein
MKQDKVRALIESDYNERNAHQLKLNQSSGDALKEKI